MSGRLKRRRLSAFVSVIHFRVSAASVAAFGDAFEITAESHLILSGRRCGSGISRIDARGKRGGKVGLGGGGHSAQGRSLSRVNDREDFINDNEKA